MTYAVSTPQQVGDRIIAVLSRQTITGHGFRGGLGLGGRKVPLIVLTRKAAEITAVDLNGDPVDLEVVEALCPGATRELQDVPLSSG